MEAAIQRELAAADQQGAECEYMNLDSRFVQARVEGLDGLTGLQELSLANCGLQSLEGFPALSQLTKVTLSDNKITGGLEPLAECKALMQLDLSGNRIASIDDLKPLASLQLKSLDLEECPVASGATYREDVYALLPGLMFLDRKDREGVEVEDDESDEEDDEEDVEEDEDDEDGFMEGDDDDDEEDEDDEEEVEEPYEEEGGPEGDSQEEDEEEEEEEDDDDEDDEEEPGTAGFLGDYDDDDEDEGFDPAAAPGEDDEDDDEDDDDGSGGGDDDDDDEPAAKRQKDS